MKSLSLLNNKRISHGLLAFVLILLAPSLLATERYITAGGTITEIVFALSAGDKVVAVDQSSSYPRAATEKPMVGYYRDLAAEGVLSLAPTHLLAIEGTGRDNALQQMRAVGVDVKVYKKPVDVKGLISLIQDLGNDLDKTAQAEALITRVKNSLPEKAKDLRGKAVFLLSAGERGIIAAGTETVPDLIFSYTGISNLAAGHEGFKPLNTEALTAMQPDFIVVPRHTFMAAGGKQGFCKQPSLQLMKAVKQCKVLVMDSLLSLGMTTRLAEAISTVDAFAGE